MATLRVGVAGTGQGVSHIRGFAAMPDVDVVALCDLKPARAQRIAQEHGIPRAYTSLEELLDQPDIDIIVVATPDHLHGQHTIAALQAGKHVQSEIPMAIKPEEMLEIVRLCQQTGLKYQMGNQVRHDPAILSVKAQVEAGRLGDIFYGEAEYFHNMTSFRYDREGDPSWRFNPAHPQTTLLGGGPHAIDTLRWLMGVDNFVEAHAYGNRKVFPDRGDDDFTVALLQGDNGAVAKIAVSYGLVRPYVLYYSVYGTRGTYECDRHQEPGSGRITNYLYYADTPFVRRMIPMEMHYRVHPAERVRSGHGTMEVSQAREFVAAVWEDRQPLLGPVEAARSCLAGAAALESVRTGRPVPVPPVP